MVDFFKVSMSFTQLLNHCESLREQVQTRLKQVDKNGFETIKNGSKLIRRASEIEALGLLGRGRGGDPQKSLIFIGSWPPWRLDFGVPFGTLFGSGCHPGSPWTENWRFWGGLVAEYFFEEILSPFWRVSGQWKQWFCMRGVAKITISPKSEFYYFLTKFWRSFWNQNLPKMALGLAMGRPQWPSAPILGGPETDPKKSIK